MQPAITADLLRTAAAILAGSSSSEAATDFQEVLQRRLDQYYTVIGRYNDEVERRHSMSDLQYRTAQEALYVLENLQTYWKVDIEDNLYASASAPEQDSSQGAIGARDWAALRILTSLVFKWTVEPLLGSISNAIPRKSSTRRHVRTEAKIIDLTGVPADYTSLTACISRLLRLLLPDGVQSTLLQTAITSIVVNRHLKDLLRPCLALGWLPRNLASESVQPVDDVRPLVMRLLAILPVSQTMTALGGILSDDSLSLPYVRKSCGFLLSRQLLRPEGVHGLLTAVFGDEDVNEEDAPLEKLEHVGKLLSAVPASMSPEAYYGVIIPRLLTLLSVEQDKTPPAHRRALAFALSHMLVGDQNEGGAGPISNILLPLLQRSFLHPSSVIRKDNVPGEPEHQWELAPSSSLSALETLLTNADPSPAFITSLLTPIVPPLFAILFHLETTRTSDPAAKETVRGLLSTWGRVVGAKEGVRSLWSIIQGEGGEWKEDVTGNLTLSAKPERTSSLSLFTPEDLKRAEEAGELDMDTNLFDLSPDPVRFVRFLKSIERSDIASELFVTLLEAYKEVKTEADADPLRTLLYLQLILQMQDQLTTDNATSNILSKPDHILSFIKHALESARAPAPPSSQGHGSHNPSSLKLSDLRIVAEEESDELNEGDSDDEAPDATSTGPNDDEIVMTAINLLLSILEAHPDLSARTAPILNEIFSLLEPLTRDSSETIRPLAREARMVMTARLASTSASASAERHTRKKDEQESPQETYQKALKLLQDPLLPVRAHGLLLLRQLVSARRTNSKAADTAIREPVIERALIPGILSIFLQSVQDDDSYIFLNAVQGLAAMVDGFGKDVLKGLINVYAEGLEGLGGTTMTQHDVDVRTRVGEALGQVIRRCGDALPAYANILVPSLFGVMRTAHFPTTLRTSAISLLAQCAKTNALAVIPYAVDLAAAMIDLLQVESVPSAPRPSKSTVDTVHDTPSDEADAPTPTPVTMDSQPTSNNTKFPPLRRAALYFLSLLIQACISLVYESTGGDGMLPAQLSQRAKTTLQYIAATDEDAVVRVMARETAEQLDQLGEAMLGL